MSTWEGANIVGFPRFIMKYRFDEWCRSSARRAEKGPSSRGQRSDGTMRRVVGPSRYHPVLSDEGIQIPVKCDLSR